MLSRTLLSLLMSCIQSCYCCPKLRFPLPSTITLLTHVDSVIQVSNAITQSVIPHSVFGFTFLGLAPSICLWQTALGLEPRFPILSQLPEFYSSFQVFAMPPRLCISCNLDQKLSTAVSKTLLLNVKQPETQNRQLYFIYSVYTGINLILCFGNIRGERWPYPFVK